LGGNEAEWGNGTDHWAVRKTVRTWVDENDRTRVTYFLRTDKPDLRYYVGSTMTTTKSLWYYTSDGQSIEAVIPDNADSFNVDAWILPQIDSN
jgi:hypothetical protein